MIIQIIGLPGSGKTTLAKAFAQRTNAIHFNADEVRADLNQDLGFTAEDRVEQARRMGALARLTDKQGYVTIVDFVCPTKETRDAFGKADYVIWMNRVSESRYIDTNKLWEEPEEISAMIGLGFTVEEEIEMLFEITGLPDWKSPTTLMLGRYQPWHEGHKALLDKAFDRTEQVVIGVRDTHGTSEKDPLTFNEVAEGIKTTEQSPFIVKMPNITNIVYGRDVGYKIEQIDLGADIHAISATQKRKEMGI